MDINASIYKINELRRETESSPVEKTNIERDYFEKIKKYLLIDDILVLHGARQVGKTHIMYFLKSYLEKKQFQTFYIDLEDNRFLEILDKGVPEFIKLLKEEGLSPDSFNHKNKLFVFIDEIQYLSNPSSFLKLIADHHKQIKLIVSGSSSFEIKSKFKDSLVGRVINFEIFPLSFREFLRFKNYHWDGGTDLTEKKIGEMKEYYKEYAIGGGYPKVVLEERREFKEKYLQQIVSDYIKKDIRDLANIKDVGKFNKLLEVLAEQSGKLLNITELANTCDLSKQTIENHLFIMENTYVIKLVRPYSKNIRSELFKTPKIFFYDTGLSNLLNAKELPRELTGVSFETSIFSELIKKFSGENVFYWRTQDKKEIDFILRLKNDILPIEIKLNFNNFNKTAVNYFCKHYKIKKYWVIGLGQKIENGYYPWEFIS